MEEQVELRLFTAADLEAYFFHNRPVELLSEKVISHTRAFAVINNPYVEKDTVIVSALFVNGEVAAFTYVIPDEVNGQRVFWNSVLSVDPKFEGRGYGYIVIGQMVEIYGDRYFDLDAVPASVSNLQYAGLVVEYIDQYILEQKNIHTESLKGKLVSAKENFRIWKAYKHLQETLPALSSVHYTLRYMHYIDDRTYAFIRDNSANNLFVRSQEMFNWLLGYPLGEESPNFHRVPRVCAFPSARECFRFYAVQVFVEDLLVGVYIFRKSKEELYLNYLYYEPEYEAVVYQSLAEHVLSMRPTRFFTAHRSLTEYLDAFHLFAHKRVYKKSFSYPKSFLYDPAKFIQAGDGDNIT